MADRDPTARRVAAIPAIERFARTLAFLETEGAADALLAFAAALPWIRAADAHQRAAEDDRNARSIADWTEQILRAHAGGATYYCHSSIGCAFPDEDSSPSGFVLDELIRCHRPEAVAYRNLLQRATVILDPSAPPAPFPRTGWYDDGRAQIWAFVFERTDRPPVSASGIGPERTTEPWAASISTSTTRPPAS